MVDTYDYSVSLGQKSPWTKQGSQLPTLLPDIMCIYSTLLGPEANFVVPRQGFKRILVSCPLLWAGGEGEEEAPALNGLTLIWWRDLRRPPHILCL